MRENNMYRAFDYGRKHLKKYQRWLAPSRELDKGNVYVSGGTNGQRPFFWS